MRFGACEGELMCICDELEPVGGNVLLYNSDGCNYGFLLYGSRWSAAGGGTGWSGTAVAGQEDFGTSAQEQEVQRRSDLQLIYQWIDQEQLGDGYPKIIDVTYFNSSEYCSRWMKKIVYIA